MLPWSMNHSSFASGLCGQQGVGRVVRSGARASKFAEGTRVVAVPWPGNTPSGGAPYTARLLTRVACIAYSASRAHHVAGGPDCTGVK